MPSSKCQQEARVEANNAWDTLHAEQVTYTQFNMSKTLYQYVPYMQSGLCLGVAHT